MVSLLFDVIRYTVNLNTFLQYNDRKYLKIRNEVYNRKLSGYNIKL